MDAEQPQRPFVAGMYDYYLGGTTNSAADRAAVEQVRAVVPQIGRIARANRDFLQRSVARIAGEWGVRQFLDIGAGLPTQRNTHEVVRDAIGANETATVLYVDVDPLVITHGRILLEGIPGAAVIQGDLRDPKGIFDTPEAQRLLDLEQPIGVLMFSVTQFVLDADDPWGVVRQYVDRMAPGSYLALSAPTSENLPPEIMETIKRVYRNTPNPAQDRSRADVLRFFDGLDIVAPYEGVEATLAYAAHWGTDPTDSEDEVAAWMYAAVARKP